jgi:hypothetical protein
MPPAWIGLKYIVQKAKNAEEESVKRQRKRKRKIIWFNPPFYFNVQTNIGKEFFKLLKKHFPRDSNFYKIFNKNTVKLSYSCTKNIGTIVSSHNNGVLSQRNETYGCIFRVKSYCPLENNYLTPSIIYQAEITNNTDTEKKKYILDWQKILWKCVMGTIPNSSGIKNMKR